MIINNLDDKKIKILIDETDLKNSKIPVFELISNSSKTLLYIQQLLSNISKFPEELTIKNYSIYTYNYKIFLIILSI